MASPMNSSVAQEMSTLGSSTSLDEKQLISPVVEASDAERKRVFRKLDVTLLPFVSLLYLLSFLCVQVHLLSYASLNSIFPQGSV
jgi:hypothetical protein